MDYLWTAYSLNPVKEYKFHPTRKWRFDYAFPEVKVAVEIEGGIFAQGRHTRGVGFLNDMEKYNSAAALGWRVLRFTPQQLKKGIAQLFTHSVLFGDKPRTLTAS